MERTSEKWQEYTLTGEPLKNGGYSAQKGNPRFGTTTRVGGACVWLFRRTDSGVEILSQKRAEHIDNGGKWDVSAGGHIDYGETPVEAAVREAREEIGVEISPERLIHVISLPNFPITMQEKNRNMFNHHYLYDWTGKDDIFHFDNDEVSEIRWIPLSNFDAFAKENLKPNWRDNRPLLEVVKAWFTYYGNN